MGDRHLCGATTLSGLMTAPLQQQSFRHVDFAILRHAHDFRYIL